jgi:hypothetical protein
MIICPMKWLNIKLANTHGLPEEIRTALTQNKDLQVRLPHIVSVYHAWKEHPCFTPAAFREKLEYCIRYSHQKAAFGAYLHKALLNEWNKKPRTRTSEKPAKSVPTDLPEWVATQNDRYSQSTKPQNNELTPDQKAELNRLLKALEEVSTQ